MGLGLPPGKSARARGLHPNPCLTRQQGAPPQRDCTYKVLSTSFRVVKI